MKIEKSTKEPYISDIPRFQCFFFSQWHFDSTLFCYLSHPDTSSIRCLAPKINTLLYIYIPPLTTKPMLRVQLRLVAVAVMVAIIVVIYYLDSIADKSNLQLQHHFLDALTHFPHLTGFSDNNHQQYMLEKAKKLGKDQEISEAVAQDEALDPCTIINPHSHGFIDLRGLSSLGNEGRALPWTTKGYDYGRNARWCQFDIGRRLLHGYKVGKVRVARRVLHYTRSKRTKTYAKILQWIILRKLGGS